MHSFLVSQLAWTYTGTMTEKQVIVYDDGDYEPESVRERRASSGRSGSLPGMVGSNGTDTVYLISTETQATRRKYLLGPLIFSYIAGYITTYITFVLYVYDTVHNDIFAGQKEQTFSACNDSTNKSDPEYKMQVRIQQESSNWATYYSLAAGIPSIIANVVFSCYTDRFGRRFLLLLPCVGSLLKLIVYSIGVYFKLSLSYFFIGSIIEGMTGQLYTILVACFTYIADVTPKKGKERSFSIVVIELSIGLRSSIFSFASGYFIKYSGYFYPLLTSGALFAIASVIVLFIPESFPKHKRYHGNSPLDILKTIYDLFLGDFNWGRRWMYNVLLIVFALTMFTVFGRSSVEPIYFKDNPFCWSAEKIGCFAALKSAASQSLGMIAVKLMQKKMSDESIAILGCFSFAGCFLLEGLAFNDLMMYTGKCTLYESRLCSFGQRLRFTSISDGIEVLVVICDHGASWFPVTLLLIDSSLVYLLSRKGLT